MHQWITSSVLGFAVFLFAISASAQEAPPTRMLTEHTEETGIRHHHEYGARSHIFESLAFMRIHSTEGLAGEFLLEVHPCVFPVGFGILVGAYGLPSAHDGFFNLNFRFVIHLHRPDPLDVRIVIGVDEGVVPSFRTLANAAAHITFNWNIAPVFAPSISHFPEAWGRENRGGWRLDLPVGIRVRLPYRESATYLAAFVNLIFEDVRTSDMPALGSMIMLEQRLF